MIIPPTITFAHMAHNAWRRSMETKTTIPLVYFMAMILCHTRNVKPLKILSVLVGCENCADEFTIIPDSELAVGLYAKFVQFWISSYTKKTKESAKSEMDMLRHLNLHRLKNAGGGDSKRPVISSELNHHLRYV